jgi:uncharacterized small protein (DUF1192 family)
MRSRFAVILLCSAVCAPTVVGCADGGSSVTRSSATVPQAAQQGAVSGGQASVGRRTPSGARRTLSVPTCSGTGADAFVGGAGSNVAGGQYAFVGAGSSNQACDEWSAIAGGLSNAISYTTGGDAGFIGGGEYNVLTGNDSESAIVGGDGNQVTAGESSIVGGEDNSIAAGDSLIGGGEENMITAAATADGAIVGGNQNRLSGQASFLGGGVYNNLSGTYGAVAGGYTNKMSAEYGFIGAGSSNTVSGEAAVVAGGQGSYAEGAYATVPGGYDNNAAGELSFAAGFKSYARYAGSFVWSDYASGATLLESTAVNQFLARATGGFTLWTNAANTVGATLAPGSGTWASASDRNLKTDVARIDDAAVLDKVAALPISRWSYKSERGVRHVGPMAQDFYAAFGVGEDDKHITSIDEDGVALAAIKALHARVAAMDAENAHLRAQLARYRASTDARLARLTAAVAMLQAR